MGTSECLPQEQVASAACSFSLCSRCSIIQKTCCQTTEIYVTPGDLLRIRDATGESDFFEFRTPDNPEYLDQEDDPAWAYFVFRPDRSRRILRHKENGDCLFLTASGCRLTSTARPLVCRIYPYAYRAGQMTGIDCFCPVHLLSPGESIVDALDMANIDLPSRWISDLYREILMERPEDPDDRRSSV